MHRPGLWLIALLVTLQVVLLPGCERSSAPVGERPLRVVVSIPPLEGLVRPLLPPDAAVTVIVPAGQSVHGYEATPADRAAIERADLVVSVGLGVEGSASSMLARSPGRRVVFADAVGIASTGAHDHDHDHAGHDHAHEGAVDPHLWLDPLMVRALVVELGHAIEAEFPGESPEHAAPRVRSLTDASRSLLAKIDALDAEYRDRLAPFAGARVVTHHAAWSRLAERYNIEIAAVIRPLAGPEPTPGELAAAGRAIAEGGAVAVLVEPQFDASWAKRVADQAGVPVGTLDPIGEGDWFKMMRANLDELVRVLSESRDQSDSDAAP